MPNSGRAVDSAVRAILAQDPIWAAYAIADLRPDQARFCRWLVAPDASGLALIYRGLKPPILLCVGPADGVAAALADAELPAHAFLSVRQQHLPPLLQHYAQIDKQEMLRSTWPAGRQAPAPLQPTVRLGCADGQRLEALYGCGGPFAPDAFANRQLDDGYFFGIEDCRGALAAAGGTHIAFRSHGPRPHPPHNGTSFDSVSDPRGRTDKLDEILLQGVAAIGNV